MMPAAEGKARSPPSFMAPALVSQKSEARRTAIVVGLTHGGLERPDAVDMRARLQPRAAHEGSTLSVAHETISASRTAASRSVTARTGKPCARKFGGKFPRALGPVVPDRHIRRWAARRNGPG